MFKWNGSQLKINLLSVDFPAMMRSVQAFFAPGSSTDFRKEKWKVI
jgi:hypothetical protein